MGLVVSLRALRAQFTKDDNGVVVVDHGLDLFREVSGAANLAETWRARRGGRVCGGEFQEEMGGGGVFEVPRFADDGAAQEDSVVGDYERSTFSIRLDAWCLIYFSHFRVRVYRTTRVSA